MEQFKEKLLRHKIISVWGVGYLGYTEIIKLQSRGFKANVFDFTNAGFSEKIKKNGYPDKEQIYSWSERGNVDEVDISRINISEGVKSMFTSNIHILAFPVVDREGNNLLRKLSNIFLGYKKEIENTLIIFLSAGTPGTIDKNFIEIIDRDKINCSFVSASRSDWTVEEFLSDSKIRMLAANDKKSLEKATFFYDLLGIKYRILSSIKEAEIYENAKNGFQYTAEVFINQLAIAYPDTNIRMMIKYFLKDIELNESYLTIGAGGYKMPHSVQNILDGSDDPNALSLVKEVQNANVSMILSYAEMIKKMGYKSATILGISVKGHQKNIEISPSVILAEYLNKLNVTVYVDDPFYDKKSLKKLLPFCKFTNILNDKLQSEVLFVMTDHNKYKFITQNDIDELDIYNAALIIDNAALLDEFKFSPSTVYHAIGDGKRVPI